MIFFFTGTGNSLWVAKTLSAAFSEELSPMADFNPSDKPIHVNVSKNEKIGFVFPVHSWGVPLIVKKFIKNIEFEGFCNNQIFTVMTCGDECGYSNLMITKLLAEKGLECRHIYSLQMPNNYIVFPGFDIDSKELQEEKVEKAKISIKKIEKAISEDRPIDFYIKGSNTFVKSRMIYPMFCKYALNSKPFHSTDKCNGCGLCEKKCPTKNIIIKDGRPQWGENCTQCLSCIHRCPQKAIEYGKVSINKGRYVFGR